MSVACSSSTPTFAVSAAGWLATPTRGNRTTTGLTSPSLPSQLTKPNEMLQLSRQSTMLFNSTPGELSIWDINQQKIQVFYY